MSDQAAQPIQLPLITQCPAAMPSSDLRGGGNEPTITMQLKTLGGQATQVAPGAVLAPHQPQAATTPKQPVSLGRQAHSAEQGKSVSDMPTHANKIIALAKS